MSDQLAGFEGRVPRFYDEGLGPVLFTDFADQIAGRVAAYTPMHVLETAAGTGIVTRRLRDLLPAAAHLTASDLNSPMLDVARTKFRPGELVEFKPADAIALPFPAGAFDAVVCQFGFMFFPDKVKSYREVHRVLADGGRYVFSVWDAEQHNPHVRVTHEIAQGFLPVGTPKIYEAAFGQYQIDPIKEALITAAFGDIRISVVNIEKAIPDTAAFARALIYANVVINQVQAHSSVALDRVVDALTEALSREFGASPTRIPLQAIVFEARRR